MGIILTLNHREGRSAIPSAAAAAAATVAEAGFPPRTDSLTNKTGRQPTNKTGNLLTQCRHRNGSHRNGSHRNGSHVVTLLFVVVCLVTVAHNLSAQGIGKNVFLSPAGAMVARQPYCSQQFATSTSRVHIINSNP